jgi:hypothetical protein
MDINTYFSRLQSIALKFSSEDTQSKIANPKSKIGITQHSAPHGAVTIAFVQQTGQKHW